MCMNEATHMRTLWERHTRRVSEVVAQLGGELVRVQLHGLARLAVAVAIEEPGGDLELQRVGDEGDEAVDLIVRELARALARVDLRLLADEAGQAAAALLAGETDAPDSYEEELTDVFGGSLDRAVRRRREILAVHADNQNLQLPDLRKTWIAYPEYWAA